MKTKTATIKIGKPQDAGKNDGKQSWGVNVNEWGGKGGWMLHTVYGATRKEVARRAKALAKILQAQPTR